MRSTSRRSTTSISTSAGVTWLQLLSLVHIQHSTAFNDGHKGCRSKSLFPNICNEYGVTK